MDFSFLFHIILKAKEDVRMKFTVTNGRPVSSVDRVPGYRAGCRGFKPKPDQRSGSLYHRGESAAFVMTSANG